MRKGRGRDSTEDASHCPKILHAKLSQGLELLVVELRKLLLLPLDDFLALTHEFIIGMVSRSGLGRCLRRQGVSNLASMIPREGPEKTPARGVKAYEPGIMHVNVKYLLLDARRG